MPEVGGSYSADPTGSGIVDTDIVKQGWVPAGCLLETNVPVASAIAEATAAKERLNFWFISGQRRVQNTDSAFEHHIHQFPRNCIDGLQEEQGRRNLILSKMMPCEYSSGITIGHM